MQKICTFCGHGKEWDLPIDIDIRIENAILNLIAKEVYIFYSGGMGAFDKKCEAIIRKFKNNHKGLKLMLVIPYITKSLNDTYVKNSTGGARQSFEY